MTGTTKRLIWHNERICRCGFKGETNDITYEHAKINGHHVDLVAKYREVSLKEFNKIEKEKRKYLYGL